MKYNNNSYSIRFYNNHIPYNYLSNNSDISNNFDQKIMTGERNLNDLNLETETELSKKDSDLSFVLNGLKKEIDEISHNIIETDKKVKGFSQQNLENSKRLRQKSYNNLKLYNKEKDIQIQNQINFYSPEKYYKYQSPSSKHNKINNIYDNNLINNKTFSTYNNYNFNNDDNNINTYYKKDININNIDNKSQKIKVNNNLNAYKIQKGFIKQINKSFNKNNNENSLDIKVNELKNELNPLKDVIHKLFKDINSLKEIAYQECGEKFDYEVECLCSLKDNSFLCGLSNRFGCILKQYVFKGKTIEEVASKSFESYKQDFNNIYQLKSGNIIGTISSGDFFLFLKN